MTQPPVPDYPTRRKFLQHAAATALILPSDYLVGQSTSDQPIRVAQIGTGHAHASGKWKVIQQLNEFEVVGIAEPDPNLKAQLGQAVYANAKVLTLDEILSDDSIEMVVVETAVRDLLSVAETCIRAGKHLHLDKPAGADLEHFKRVIQLARHEGKQIQMGYMFRYNPAFILCHRAIRERWLGQIFSVEAVMSKQSGDLTRQALAEFKGGTMFELGCHLIDALVWLLGAPSQVHAFERQSRATDSLADNQLAVLEYEDTLVTVRSALIEVQGMQRRQLVLCGERGTLEVRPLEPPNVRLTLDRAAGGYPAGKHDIPMQPVPRYREDFRALAQAIRAGEPMPFDYQHDLVVQETVLRASGML